MKDLVIVGAGGFARDVAWLIKEINSDATAWHFLGFVEADHTQVGRVCGDATVIGDDQWLLQYEKELGVAVAIGNLKAIDRIRQSLCIKRNLSFPNLVHPSTLWDRKRIEMGVGNIVCAHNIFTTDIRIGSFNLFNLASTFGHDDVIGDCCAFNPGVNIAGRVTIGNRCLVGTGAAIFENLTLGDDVVVGGGSVVTRDVHSGLTVFGNPAKPLYHP
jgi:sugar O-acyltransferase (sialic acid O-acetyltransferase NeuD family)